MGQSAIAAQGYCGLRDTGPCWELGLLSERGCLAFARDRHVVAPGARLDRRAGRAELAVLRRGVGKLVVPLADGGEQILEFLFPGDVLCFPGEDSAGEEMHLAVTEAEFCRVRDPLRADRGDEFDGVWQTALKTLLGRLSRRYSSLVMLGSKRPECRLAHVLLMFFERLGKTHESGHWLDLPAARSEIASFTCLSNETVSRTFRLLKESGVIQTSGQRRIRFADLGRLRALACGEVKLA